ncbi:protein TolB [Nitrospira sp.]|nr:protein TolB [Nitrospira sp.]
MKTARWVAISIGLAVAFGLGSILDSRATDVFLEATRSDVQKIPLGIVGFRGLNGADWLGSRIEEVLKADLRRSLVFSLVDLPSIGIKVRELKGDEKDVFRQATDNGVSVMVWGKASTRDGGKETEALIDGFVYDGGSNEVISGKRYVGTSGVARLMAHRFADELVFRYTGEQGIARTKIAYVAEQKGARELFVMDYDGHDPRQVTADGYLNLMPRWSADRRFLIFTAYRSRNTQDIDMIELATGKRWTLISKRGLNITPSLSPDGNFLAFASSEDGNSEIYKQDTRSKAFTRLTSNPAGDLSPTWSPTGREIAFVSDRGGGPQLYVMSADGSNVRRLTYDGDYNAAPAWSPKGNWIAYVCRTARREYKICLITPDGQKRQQVTSGQGLDDSPAWSPDGRHLVFSSLLDGKSHIYMINADGKDLERITFEGTQNSSPTWSPA